jgi:uncharacterized membrane protein
MNWKRFIKLMALLIPLLLLLDAIWLGILMKSFYAQQVGAIMRQNETGMDPRWGAAIVVYLLIPIGLIVFVRPRIGDRAGVGHAFGWGAIFGFVLYGVYDFTNLAVLEVWTTAITLADVFWGGVLCGVLSSVMYVIDRN